MAFDAFEELAGSPVLDFAPDHSTGWREAKVPWAQVATLLQEIFPLSGFGPPSTMPGFPFMVARSMHVEPFLGDRQKLTAPDDEDLDYNSVNAYDAARVRITYETPPYDQDQGNDPALLLSHRWSIGGEFLTLEPKQGFEWYGGDSGVRVVDDDTDDDLSVGVLIPTIEHQMTWPRVVNPPFSVIRDRLGCINSTPRTFNTGVIFPETLLFLGAELRRDVLTSGALAWEVVYRFSERKVPLAETDYIGGDDGNDELTVGGWNHFYRNDKGLANSADEKSGFYRLRIAAARAGASAKDVYLLKSFGELFVEGN